MKGDRSPPPFLRVPKRLPIYLSLQHIRDAIPTFELRDSLSIPRFPHRHHHRARIPRMRRQLPGSLRTPDRSLLGKRFPQHTIVLVQKPHTLPQNIEPCLSFPTAKRFAKPTAKRHPWSPPVFPSMAGTSLATSAKSPWRSSSTSATPTTQLPPTRPLASSSTLSGAR